MNIKLLLFYRWLCVNLFGLAFLTVSFFNGWLNLIFSSDSTGIVYILFVIFTWGLALCGYKLWNINKDLNYIKEGNPFKCFECKEYYRLINVKKSIDGSLIDSLKLKLFSKLTFIRYLAGILVILGLVGTVIGFIIALSGVDPKVTSDISAIGPMVSLLIQGMYVALYTTLVGAILNIWLMLNYQLLAMSMTKLVTDILELESSDIT